jgi:hypothetical protein
LTLSRLWNIFYGRKVNRRLLDNALRRPPLWQIGLDANVGVRSLPNKRYCKGSYLIG